MNITSPAITRLLAHQHALVTVAQVTAAGMTRVERRRTVCAGHVEVVHGNVLALAGVPWSPDRRQMAACLATGGRSSHRAAAALLGILLAPPPQPEVTVASQRNNGRPGITVHRSNLVVPPVAPRVRGIPCTTPVQTILDLANVVEATVLDEAVDRSLARRMLDVTELDAELRHRSGRRGTDVLRTALRRRGYVGAPHPSVLESQFTRLLAAAGITPLAVERCIDPYRIDVTLADDLHAEVDGYAYHANPDAMRHDLRRRNELRRLGHEILVYTWVDVRDEPDRIIQEVRAALQERRRVVG